MSFGTQAIFFHNSTLGLEKGDIAILQNYSLEGDPHPFVQSPRQSRPDATYEMQVTDPVLRLLVGGARGDFRLGWT